MDVSLESRRDVGVECFAFYFNLRAFGHEPRRADKLCPDDGTIDGK